MLQVGFNEPCTKILQVNQHMASYRFSHSNLIVEIGRGDTEPSCSTHPTKLQQTILRSYLAVHTMRHHWIRYSGNHRHSHCTQDLVSAGAVGGCHDHGNRHIFLHVATTIRCAQNWSALYDPHWRHDGVFLAGNVCFQAQHWPDSTRYLGAWDPCGSDHASSLDSRKRNHAAQHVLTQVKYIEYRGDLL